MIVERTNLVPGNFGLYRYAASCDYVTEHFDAEFAEEELSQSSNCYACGGFAGRGALENISGFGEVVLQGSSEVGVAGAWRGNALVLGGVAFAYWERFLPVFPIAVFELDGDG